MIFPNVSLFPEIFNVRQWYAREFQYPFWWPSDKISSRDKQNNISANHPMQQGVNIQVNKPKKYSDKEF